MTDFHPGVQGRMGPTVWARSSWRRTVGKRPALNMLVWVCPAQGLDPELAEVTDPLITG